MVSASLDRRLARGELPQSTRLLAARADALVASAARGELARDLDSVRTQARNVPGSHRARVSLNRSAIVACDRQIRELLDVLVAPAAPPARGVAMVSVLLTDGTGPLFNSRRSADLSRALNAAALHMDRSLVAESGGCLAIRAQ